MLAKNQIEYQCEHITQILSYFPRLGFDTMPLRDICDQAALAVDLAAEVERLKAVVAKFIDRPVYKHPSYLYATSEAAIGYELAQEFIRQDMEESGFTLPEPPKEEK